MSFASRQILPSTTAGIYITQSNVAPTFENGNPAPYYSHSVWYQWQPNVTASNQVTTPFKYALNNNGYKSTFFKTLSKGSPTFPTTLTVFQNLTTASAALTNLTPVTYTGTRIASQSYGGNLGSEVVFFSLNIAGTTPQSGSTYYIRVDSDSSGRTGTFDLTWGDYWPEIYNFNSSSVFSGSMTGSTITSSFCGPDWCNYQCVGVINVNTSASIPVTFGTQSAGRYAVQYCGGASTLRADQLYVVSEYVSGPPYVITYDSGSGPHNASININQIHGVNVTGGDGYSSIAGAWIDNLPLRFVFDHVGGSSIDITPYDDEADEVSLNSDPSMAPPDLYLYSAPYGPNYGLYKVVPTFVAVTACASWVTPGSTAQSTFTFRNIGCDAYAAGDIKITLLATGGITSPSSPNTSFSIGGPNAIATVTFDFNCSTENVTATLQFSSNNAIFTTFNLVYVLNPLITATVGSFSQNGTCDGIKRVETDIEFSNAGYFQLPLAGTMSLNNGVNWILGDCSAAPAFNTTAIGAAGFVNATPACSAPALFFVNIYNPTASINTVITASVQGRYSGITVGTFYLPCTVPHL